jgi:hypothetical protein
MERLKSLIEGGECCSSPWQASVYTALIMPTVTGVVSASSGAVGTGVASSSSVDASAASGSSKKQRGAECTGLVKGTGALNESRREDRR